MEYFPAPMWCGGCHCSIDQVHHFTEVSQRSHRRGRADRDCLADAGWITGERRGWWKGAGKALVMGGMWQFLLAICFSIKFYFFHPFSKFSEACKVSCEYDSACTVDGISSNFPSCVDCCCNRAIPSYIPVESCLMVRGSSSSSPA